MGQIFENFSHKTINSSFSMIQITVYVRIAHFTLYMCEMYRSKSKAFRICRRCFCI